MRWNKKDKNLILQVIEKYKKMINGERVDYECPFCEKYDDCDDCPNVLILKFLKMEGRCLENLVCFEDELVPTSQVIHLPNLHFPIFPWDTRDMKHGLLPVDVVKRRRRLWEDTLKLTEKEFVKKYKKE